VHGVEIVEMDDEEVYVPDDVLEEASAARYQILSKNQNYSDRKTVSESDVNERETNLHLLVAKDTDRAIEQIWIFCCICFHFNL
jgi:hypothetical protein